MSSVYFHDEMVFFRVNTVINVHCVITLVKMSYLTAQMRLTVVCVVCDYLIPVRR